MKKTQTIKQAYTVPLCKVIQTETEKFICIYANLNPGGSTTQPNYDDKGEYDVGTVIIGDGSTIAPGKQGRIWEDED